MMVSQGDCNIDDAPPELEGSANDLSPAVALPSKIITMRLRIVFLLILSLIKALLIRYSLIHL